jgi:hypothetical protein
MTLEATPGTTSVEPYDGWSEYLASTSRFIAMGWIVRRKGLGRRTGATIQMLTPFVVGSKTRLRQRGVVIQTHAQIFVLQATARSPRFGQNRDQLTPACSIDFRLSTFRSLLQGLIFMKHQSPNLNTLPSLLIFRSWNMERRMRHSSRPPVKL